MIKQLMKKDVQLKLLSMLTLKRESTMFSYKLFRLRYDVNKGSPQLKKRHTNA